MNNTLKYAIQWAALNLPAGDPQVGGVTIALIADQFSRSERDIVSRVKFFREHGFHASASKWGKVKK